MLSGTDNYKRKKKLLSLQNKSLSECHSTLNSLMGDTLSQICQSVKCTTVDLTRLRWYEDLDVSVCEGKTTEIVSRCFYARNTELSRKRLRFSDNHKYEFIFCEKGEAVCQ